MNLQKIKSLISQIENAPIVCAGDSPYLHSCTVFGEPEGKPDEEILLFDWHDDLNNIFEIRITEKGLDEAEINDNTISCIDADGEKVIIELFDLTPAPIVKVW